MVADLLRLVLTILGTAVRICRYGRGTSTSPVEWLVHSAPAVTGISDHVLSNCTGIAASSAAVPMGPPWRRSCPGTSFFAASTASSGHRGISTMSLILRFNTACSLIFVTRAACPAHLLPKPSIGPASLDDPIVIRSCSRLVCVLGASQLTPNPSRPGNVGFQLIVLSSLRGGSAAFCGNRRVSSWRIT